MAVSLDVVSRVVNVHWGGHIIQISVDVDVEDYMSIQVFNPELFFGFIPDPDSGEISYEYYEDTEKTYALKDLDKKWITNFISKDEAKKRYFDFLDETLGFREYLIDFAHYAVKSIENPNDKAPNPIVDMRSFSGDLFEGANMKGEARLRIYSKSTTWKATRGRDGNPSTLVADRDPIFDSSNVSYDKTKVLLWSDPDSRQWEFNEEGWIDEKDLGKYKPIIEWPEPPEPPVDTSVSQLLNIFPNDQFSDSDPDGFWWPCVFERDMTVVSIFPPATHVDGTGIINTGNSAKVTVTIHIIPKNPEDIIIPTDYESAILDTSTEPYTLLANGDSESSCTVVFSGSVTAGVRKRVAGPAVSATASITSVCPPPP